jgi:multiple sugar transport system substrate-binding protein
MEVHTMSQVKTTDTKNRRLNRRALVGGGAATATAAAIGMKASPAYAAPMLNFRQGPITLQFWGGEPEESGPGDLVAAFNESQPDIQATYTRYVNDDTGNTQLDTALQGGTPIDVYQSYGIPRTSQRVQAGAALDLTPYIEADQEISDWLGTITAFTYEDTYYSLPTVKDLTIVIANQELLDTAGVTLPETWTTEEFRELAGQLTQDFAYGTFTPPDVATQILGPNRWYKEGATESNFDDPAFRQNLELHGSMIEDGSAFPWTDVLARNLRVYQQNLFLTGQVALWPSGSWVLRYVNDLEEFPHDFVTTFASVPVPADATDPWDLGTIDNNILINPTSENQDAAWEFLRFRLVDGAYTYLKAGKEPAFPGTPVEDVVAGILGENREELYNVEAYRALISPTDVRIPTDTITVASAQIQQIYQQEADRYLIGEISLDEALTSIKEQADEAIAEASA